MFGYSVAEYFSRVPGPRLKSCGEHSGEELCEILSLRLQYAAFHDTYLLVDLDGTAGYARSFIEEAFGGLVRNHKHRLKFLRDVLRIKSDEEKELIDEAWSDIEAAEEAFQQKLDEAQEQP